MYKIFFCSRQKENKMNKIEKQMVPILNLLKKPKKSVLKQIPFKYIDDILDLEQSSDEDYNQIV